MNCSSVPTTVYIVSAEQQYGSALGRQVLGQRGSSLTNRLQKTCTKKTKRGGSAKAASSTQHRSTFFTAAVQTTTVQLTEKICTAHTRDKQRRRKTPLTKRPSTARMPKRSDLFLRLRQQQREVSGCRERPDDGTLRQIQAEQEQITTSVGTTNK
jgi:hypothetical protein